MAIQSAAWRAEARERALAHFRLAWERAPEAGRAALLDAVERGGPGHRWETGVRACVLALLVQPALRPGEGVKAGAYRLFGCEVTDEFPATWDARALPATALLAAVGAPIVTPARPWSPRRWSWLARRLLAHM